MQALALAFLAATAVGGLAWVFLYPMLSGEKKAESRRASVAKSEPVARQVDRNQRTRREQVEGSLKDLDARRQKEKKVPLQRPPDAGRPDLDDAEIHDRFRHSRQPSLSWLAMLGGGGLLAAAGLAFAAGFGAAALGP